MGASCCVVRVTVFFRLVRVTVPSKMSLKRLNVDKNTGYLFFRNPPLPQISTFLLGQKRCAYYGKSAYYEWAQ